MKTSGIKLLAALAITACAASLSFAGSYKVGMITEVISKRGVFHVSDAADNTYAQVSGLKQMETSIYGEGLFSALNKNTAADETTVLGVDKGGHSNLSLKALPNGAVLVSVDKLLDDVIDGLPVKVDYSYKATAQFTRGSWEDYLAGNDVELQFTEEGQAMETEALTATDKRTMRMIKDGFSAKFQAIGAEFGEVTVERYSVKGKTVIRGSSSRLEIIGAPVSGEMSFMITGNF